MNRPFHVLVTHGTDTLAWCHAYLSYALRGVDFNIVITGSQVPLQIGFGNSDAPLNIETAVRILGLIEPAKILAVFNRGRDVFAGSLTKVHKWDADAFDGERVLRIVDGNVEWRDRRLRLRPSIADWDLHLVRTGGTIESQLEGGVLVPTGNEVMGFLGSHLKSLFHGQYDHAAFGLDSSDMTPERWGRVAERIVRIAGETRGQACRTASSTEFASDVRIVTLEPWRTSQQYVDAFQGAQGIVLSGYGGGNINIDPASKASLLPALEHARAHGIPVVLDSQVGSGRVDAAYRNGMLPLKECDVITGAGLGIAHAQVKLAWLLGHDQELVKAADRFHLDRIALLDRCMTAGMPFRHPASRANYAKLRGYQPLSWDPFVNRDFALALEEVIQGIVPTQPTGTSLVNPVDDLAGRLAALGLKEPGVRRRHAVIIRPHPNVGSAGNGDEVDAARNLAALVRNLLGLEPVLIDLHRLGTDGLERAVRRCVGDGLSWSAFLRSFGFLAVEGGCQSVHVEENFRTMTPALSRQDYLNVLQELILARTLPGSQPGAFICLGHQGYSAALVELALQAVGDRTQDLLDAVRAVPGAAIDLPGLEAFLTHARSAGEAFPQFDDLSRIIATSLLDPKATVWSNEQRESLLIELHPHAFPAPQPASWPPDLAQAYQEVAGRYQTQIELWVASQPKVCMFHGDEVVDGSIYFANWVFHRLHGYLRPLEGVPADELPKILRDFVLRLPIGCEITATTWYSDFLLRTEGRAIPGNQPLTDVAALAVYFRGGSAAAPLYDCTFQFHPELPDVDRFYDETDMDQLELGTLTDGIRILAHVLRGGEA